MYGKEEKERVFTRKKNTSVIKLQQGFIPTQKKKSLQKNKKGGVVKEVVRGLTDWQRGNLLGPSKIWS